MVILAIVFALNVLIRFPFQKPVNIGKNGAACLEEPKRRWFVLENGSYAVDGAFETISIRSSAIPLLSRKYTYYNVTITSGNDSFVMPVRVTAKDADSLKSGNTVTLYGMVSKLDEGLREKQNQALSGQKSGVTHMCLNDNGDTAATRILSAGVFALLTAVCVWLAFKIYNVR